MMRNAVGISSFNVPDGFGFIAGANILPDVQNLANALPGELAKLEAAYGLAA